MVEIQLETLQDLRDRLTSVVVQQPYPLLFATVSGAHLYGFPSPDSDYDLRGVHILPLAELVGLNDLQETLQCSRQERGFELDLVTHDIGKFFGLLLKRNGYVLEQVMSPLIVHSTPELEELKAIAPGCITRFHSKHYMGFAKSQWHLFEKENPKQVKPLLYVYRVLLTGIHLMRSGVVEANLATLNAEYRLPLIADLMRRKVEVAEAVSLSDGDIEFHRQTFQSLCERLEREEIDSQLPSEPNTKAALNDLLVRVRLASGA